MARQTASTDDDAVALRPEDLHVVVPLTHSRLACAGAAAAFVIRRIAYRAGAYAPGIQEFLFNQLTTPRAGHSVDAVAEWFAGNLGELHGMGYRVVGRRIYGERTEEILRWIGEGNGFRGALLATDFHQLHPTAEGDCQHAVGVVVDKLEPTGQDELVMADPWPGTQNGARDRDRVSPQLDAAHRSNKYATIIFYWAGYS
ncbi:MAG: hypothetical protein KC468_07725 [Myxococcales bacterium]|nr:hypothetical protein [Myxococcales bacterium]MCA9714562.1 hypothetical protein [Myxococcales bacterium]MCB9564016.1 hypothetical protein [Kofleriaceae bacterium]